DHVFNENRNTFRLAVHAPKDRIESGLKLKLEVVLLDIYTTCRTLKHVLHTSGLNIERLSGEDDFPRTLRARKHLTPDGIIDPPLRFRVCVQGLIHPPDLLFGLVEDPARLAFELRHTGGDIAAGSDEGSRRAQV